MLDVRAVSKQYQAGEWAVKEISLQVKESQVVTLVGESGCGKSTLLRLIAGLLEPDSGEIFFEQQKVKGPAHKLVPGHESIELVGQDFELFDYLTIFDNVAHFIDIMDKDYRRQRVGELLELCRIGRYASKYPRELSGGEQQRVALARALAKEPRLLLLDEPFSHLDPHLKKTLMEDLAHMLREEEMTALMVLHDTQDALKLSDHIALMRRGQIIQSDVPQKMYQQPVNPYAAHLFGDANIVPVRLLNNSQDENKDSKGLVRAEAWNITSKAKGQLEGKVERSFYMGGFYQLEVRCEKEIFKVNSLKDFKTGEKIYLSVEEDKVHLFK